MQYPKSKPFMSTTHAYYSAQHFFSKAEEKQMDQNDNGGVDISGGSSPDLGGLSVNMEDSFGDIIDNDTSERHIVVQKEVVITPPKKNSKKATLPSNIIMSQKNTHNNSINHNKSSQSRITLSNQRSQMGCSPPQQSNMKYSVAKPIPTNTAVTPGQKSAKSNNTNNTLSQQQPKHLQFIDKINEETTTTNNDGANDHSISTGHSQQDDLDDMIVLSGHLAAAHPQSRQQKLTQYLYKNHYHTNKIPPVYNELRVSKQLSGDSVDVFVQSTRSQYNFHGKMDDFLQRKEEKLRKLREEQAQREVQDCVFSPTIHTRKAQESVQPRGFGQFIQDQMRFVETVRQKRELRQEEKEQIEVAQVQSGPFMSTRSRQILMQRQQRTQSREHNNEYNTLGDSTHKYNNNQQHGSAKLIVGVKEPQKIVVKRRNNLDDILYQDAKRRQQSIENKQQEALAKSTQHVPLVSRESQKLVIQRFERELNAGIYELFHAQNNNIDQHLQSEHLQLPSSLNYLSMKLLMVRLGCCNEEQTFTECPESEHLFEMWKYLSQDQHVLQSDDDLPTDRLKLFCMVILKVAEPKVLQDYLNNAVAGNHNIFNFYDAPLLVKKFELFYINRLQSLATLQMHKKAEMENLQTQGLPFKPHLSQTTIQLAQRKQTRQKPNHLRQSGRGGGGEMQNFFTTKEAKELMECTFKPQISNNSKKISSNKRLLSPEELPPSVETYPADKCQELFEHAKHVHQLKKQQAHDRTTEEVEYERGRDQCTFRPAIHAVPQQLQQQQNNPQSIPKAPPQAKQHYDRLSRAREERERVREITERGYSSNKARDSSGTNNRHFQSVNTVKSGQQHKGVPRPATAAVKNKVNADLRIPLLLVDIGIGNRKERIAVYEGDRADTLARDFCIRHGLEIESIAVRLQEEIERQIELISNNQKEN